MMKQIPSKIKYADRSGEVHIKVIAEGPVHAGYWIEQALQEGELERVIAQGHNGNMSKDWESQLEENQLYTLRERLWGG